MKRFYQRSKQVLAIVGGVLLMLQLVKKMTLL